MSTVLTQHSHSYLLQYPRNNQATFKHTKKYLHVFFLMNFPRSPLNAEWYECHSKQTSPPNLCVWCCVQCWYLASYSITDKESKIFLIFIGVRGDECMLILSLARHIATTYINTGHSSALLLHQASDIITNTSDIITNTDYDPSCYQETTITFKAIQCWLASSQGRI